MAGPVNPNVRRMIERATISASPEPKRRVRVGRYLIYGLLDPRDQILRYVGKTHKRRELRLAEHIEDAKLGGSRPLHVWIRSLLSESLEPEVFVLKRIPPNESWEEAERSEIAKWGAAHPNDFPIVHQPQTPKSRTVKIRGAKLTNVHSGG